MVWTKYALQHSCVASVWRWQGQGGQGCQLGLLSWQNSICGHCQGCLWAVASARGHLSLCSGFSLMIPEVPHKLAFLEINVVTR